MTDKSISNPEDPGNEADETELIAESDRLGDGAPPTGSGAQAVRLEPEDENALAEMEVEEGVAGADLDTRAKSRH